MISCAIYPAEVVRDEMIMDQESAALWKEFWEQIPDDTPDWLLDFYSTKPTAWDTAINQVDCQTCIVKMHLGDNACNRCRFNKSE